MSDSLQSIPWTVAHQAPLSMEFSRQEYWSEEPFSSLRGLPDPGPESWYGARSPAFRQILYCLSHQETPKVRDKIAATLDRRKYEQMNVFQSNFTEAEGKLDLGGRP